jgi:hypothetical protein
MNIRYNAAFNEMTEITHVGLSNYDENIFGCGYHDTDGSASIFKFNTEQKEVKWH